MRIVRLPRSFYYVSKNSPVEVSHIAHQRRQLLRTWQRLRSEGYSGQKAAELIDIPRSTLYRWQKREAEQGVSGLEDGDRRPKQARRPQWGVELTTAILHLRETYPWMGKEKLNKLLEREGVQTSASTVGRILTYLKRRGVLREPPRNGITKRKRRLVRPYATRKPKEYQPTRPGDLIQVDTLDVRPLSSVRFKHFTARDMNSRWDILEVYRQATAGNARKFLSTLLDRAPFPVKAIQVDGGSEFMAEFEQACADRDIRLFVLPPRSPKLNGHVERAQRTHIEEFYDLYLGELDLKSVNQALVEWEHFYNSIRPHHSLDLLSPAEYLSKHYPGMAPDVQLSHMS